MGVPKEKNITKNEECGVLNWDASLKRNVNSQECSRLVECDVWECRYNKSRRCSLCLEGIGDVWLGPCNPRVETDLGHVVTCCGCQAGYRYKLSVREAIIHAWAQSEKSMESLQRGKCILCFGNNVYFDHLYGNELEEVWSETVQKCIASWMRRDNFLVGILAVGATEAKSWLWSDASSDAMIVD